ncbi:MAG: YgcG family protein [Methylophilales bacterium]|nr:YgcG family protein [Methylophilales bacterium]
MIRWITILTLCLMPLLASAEVTVPPLQHRVTDLTATLTSEQQADLESRLTAFEAKKGSQIAILIVPTTQPEDIAQYSIRVVEAWKLGRKGVDDGVLVLLAKDDHRSRIEVGYGLEGALPDVIAKRILNDVMMPYFKQADFYGGLVAGTGKIASVIDGEPLPEVQSTRENGLGANTIFMALIGAIVVGGILRSLLGRFVGGLASGGLAAVLLYFLGAGVLIAIVLGILAFFMTLVSGQRLPMGYGGGGFGGGSGGGGFSGGGGGFGGGGASGNW